eukprot:CAMPEP_0202959948 /NCGR_PEP_ID=MMETSP1396-20130829/4146_1 /ASSEMBLY_ACC=CAM_ASM_000872 /TAXON_ID= /ORGANISM="Pseudokeronopsis sp., Strain Brazil" /LENGTH=84 /DNA_ID=CAMNT_0049678865 /DNA_START=615 /DNA_END=869 /DNA_ORIENTATION=+
MLVFFLNGYVPWIPDQLTPVKEQFYSISELKIKLKPSQICIDNASILTEILEYAYSLKFDEEPNYNKVIHMFTKLLLDEGDFPN